MARAALIFLALAALALSGCQTTGGALKGKSNAGVTLPEWPAECRAQEIHASLNKGEDIRIILQRERKALDRANKRSAECAAYYDRLRGLFGGAR